MKGVRFFHSTEFKIFKTSKLGSGVFGKCFLGQLGPLKVCIKVHRREEKYEAYFPREASVLSQLCHSNLPYLYGVSEGTYKIILMSFHGHEDKSLSLYKALANKDESIMLTQDQWKAILFGLIAAINYLHSKQLLHNDIKSDNVVIERSILSVKSVLIDFGKACEESEGKRYTLSAKDKKAYIVKHPQIAPDLRDGLTRQCQATDIYSVGRIISSIKGKLCLPILDPITEKCLIYRSEKRPTTAELYEILH